MSFAELVLALNSGSSLLAGWIGTAVVQGTLLAALTWLLLRGPLRRAPAGVHATLWLIVIVKFLVPLGPAQPFSLASLVGAGSALIPAATEPVAAAPAAVEAAIWAFVAGDEGSAAIARPAMVAPVSAAPSLSWTTLLVAGYVAVVCGLLAWRWGSYLRFRRACRRLPAIGTPELREIHAIAQRLGLRRMPDVRVSDTAGAPFILGTWRTMLVLPERKIFDPAELEAVVLHELAHVRRGDLLARRLQWLAGTLLFFWPVVAWVNRRIDLLREVACDAWALRHGRLSAGDYARCLLKAVRSAAVPRFSYAPAAMASHPSHVERRIEVILQYSGFRRSRMLGFGSVALLAGWSAFALGGAAPLVRPADDAKPPHADEPHKLIFVESETTNGQTVQKVVVHGASDVPMGAGVMSIALADGNGGEPIVFMAAGGAPQPQMLESFLKRHPTADANGDGVLTSGEYQAYLIAAALSEPAKVLERFPKADLNGDGALDAAEAARLVTGNPAPEIAPRFKSISLGTAGPDDGGQVRTVVLARKLNGDGETEVQLAAPADVVIQPEIRVVRSVTNGEEGAEIEVKVVAPGGGDAPAAVAIAGAPKMAWTAGDWMPAPLWIDQNLSTVPTAQQVAQYVALATETSLAVFLENHPQSDLNGDGALTEAERTEYLAQRMSAARQKMLERFPEADANGDGELTHEELQAHLKTKAMKRVNATAGEAGAWEVKVETTDQPK